MSMADDAAEDAADAAVDITTPKRKKLKAAVTARRSSMADPPVPTKDLLSCGATLGNLAASGRIQGAFCKGRYHFYVGDSGSGKTMLCLGLFAEATHNKNFDDYRLIYDNAEDGALMEIEKFFGKKCAERLEPPSVDANGGAVYSTTIEDFYYNLYNALTHTVKEQVVQADGKKKSVDRNKPCIYVLDSMDSLDSEYSGKKFLEGKREWDGGPKAKGDYGDGKAKKNSQNARKITAMLRDTRSILVVICQTRDNIDADMFEPDQTFAGGRAIKFYAALEMWTSIAKRLKRSVNGHDRQIGIVTRVTVKKNRLTGKEWSVTVPMYWSSGVDDVGSMVDFLVDEKHWKRNQDGIIKADEFKHIAGREALIQYIEAENLEKDLQQITADVFNEIVEACKVERKPRYS